MSFRLSAAAYHESKSTVRAARRLSASARTSISRKCAFLVLPSASGA